MKRSHFFNVIPIPFLLGMMGTLLVSLLGATWFIASHLAHDKAEKISINQKLVEHDLRLDRIEEKLNNLPPCPRK